MGSEIHLMLTCAVFSPVIIHLKIEVLSFFLNKVLPDSSSHPLGENPARDEPSFFADI